MSLVYKHIVLIIIICCILLMPQMQAYADSPADLVGKGNAAYNEGKYGEAISAYDEATVEAPESPHLYFNKGAALYQKGDYSEASKAFEKAALKTRDIQLEAFSRFNLGNCAFLEAERRQDNDLNKALEACDNSIRHYQEALELAPAFNEAAENIEIVRLVMKTILDEINKRKEAQKHQEEAKKQLEELIEKQQSVLDQNKQLENERREKGDSQELRQKTDALAGDQKDLQQETEDLAKKMPKSGGQSTPQVDTPVEKHLKNAAKEQQTASEDLEQQDNKGANEHQEKALDELKDALASLNQEQNACKQKQNQQQEKQGGEQQKQQQASSDDKPPEDKEGQEEKQDAVAQLSDNAEDILDEEKENKKQRRMNAPGGYKEVERDW